MNRAGGIYNGIVFITINQKCPRGVPQVKTMNTKVRREVENGIQGVEAISKIARW